MTITKEQPGDIDIGMKAISAYWDEWAKSKGPDAIAALKQVRAALGR
jgi:TRAP-type transport system periplasmic protein